MYSLAVERYCGGYDGADCHKESTRVADARATITEDTEDVEALSSSLPILSSSSAASCDVIVPPGSTCVAELNMSHPSPECGAVVTSVDI